jgi:hypothetical protein
VHDHNAIKVEEVFGAILVIANCRSGGHEAGLFNELYSFEIEAAVGVSEPIAWGLE